MLNEYKCICGKIFNNSNKLNGHKSHCKEWYLYKYGNLDILLKHDKICSQKLANGYKQYRKIVSKEKDLRLQQWINEQHVCEHCGKIMTEYYGSGRFCSRSCANARKQTQETKQKISIGISLRNNPQLSINEAIDIFNKKRLPKLKRIKYKYTGIDLPKIKLDNIKAGYPSRTRIPYSERFWKMVLDNNNITYQQNVNIWKPGYNNYFLDFLINDKIDLEIDGSFHNDPVVKEKDIKRDHYLKNKGYIIYRIPWINPYSERNKILVKQQIDDFLEFLKNK